MDPVTQASFDEAFPNGAALFFNENTPVHDLVNLEVRESGGSVYVQGWTAPNKEFTFVLDSVEETEHGWWVKTLDGSKAFLSPLSPQRETVVRDHLDEGY